MQLNRQTILLATLVLLGGWFVFQSWGTGAGLGGGKGRGPAESERAALGDIPGLGREIPNPRDRQAEIFNASGGRNLFDYGQPPAPPPAPPRPRPVKAPKIEQPKIIQQPVKTPAQIAAESAAAEARKGPTPPPVNFDFLGYMGPTARLIGVFNVRTPEGDEIVLAGEGEIVAEKFRVQKIGYEEVEVGYVQDAFANQSKILPMGG